MNRLKRGDTIVEVLLALAILAAVLSGAYVTTSKALKTGRDAQERSEALQLAEGQLEILKSLQTKPSPNADPFGTLVGTSTFCLYFDPVNTDDTRSQIAIPTVDFTNPSAYPSQCKDTYYNMSIEKITGAYGPLFVVRVLWESILGTTSSTVNSTVIPGYSEVKLYYRAQE